MCCESSESERIKEEGSEGDEQSATKLRLKVLAGGWTPRQTKWASALRSVANYDMAGATPASRLLRHQMLSIGRDKSCMLSFKKHEKELDSSNKSSDDFGWWTIALHCPNHSMKTTDQNFLTVLALSARTLSRQTSDMRVTKPPVKVW